MAIEKDLENLSRYIEFSNANLHTYSIELTHLLLSASSEVDVVMKQICLLLDPDKRAGNIKDYHLVVEDGLKELKSEEIFIDRFGLHFKPWTNWTAEDSPQWWISHNKVKHQRNEYFAQANLQNAINAVGALLIAVTYYYKLSFSNERSEDVRMRETTDKLKPNASFLSMNPDYYSKTMIYN